MDQKNAAKIWYLKKSDLFSDFSKEEMEALERMTLMKSFGKREILYLPGEPGNHLYILKSGVVKISRILPDGKELILALLQPGEIFGEMEISGDQERSEQAEAYEDALVCMMKRDDFFRLLESKPKLAIRISKLMGFRRRLIENRIENVLFKSVPERIALLLLDLGNQFGEKGTQGVKIKIPLTHQDIANLVGAVRVTVTQELMDFKARGWIETEGRRIILKNLKGLGVFRG